MYRKLIAIVALIGVVGFLLILTACGKPTGSAASVHVNASTSAQAKSDAKALTKCLPQSAVGQLSLARTLTTHAGRENLAHTCGIPPQRKDAFEAQVLAAGENGHLTTHAGRAEFFSVTLPHIIEVNQ
jgi:hypothetical protein